MTRPLLPLGTGEVDEIDLELALLGEVTDPAALAQIDAAKAGPLREQAEALVAARDAWALRHPPLLPVSVPGPEAAPTREAAPRPGWRPLRWAAAAAALAAIALGVARFGPAAEEAPVAGLRPMGAAFPVSVSRSDGSAGPWAAGDQAVVAVRPPRAGVLTLASLQADGVVTVLDVATVQAGEPYQVPAGVALDAYAGREWLVASLADAAAGPPAFVALLPDPRVTCSSSSSCVAVEVTRGGAR